MRRKYTYSKKVIYIFSINAKDLRRCEGFAKEIYTPAYGRQLKKIGLDSEIFNLLTFLKIMVCSRNL